MKMQEFVFRKITRYTVRKFVIRDLVIKLYAAFFDSMVTIPTYQNRDSVLTVGSMYKILACVYSKKILEDGKHQSWALE